MVGILIVSHGNLAEALISSVQILVGNLQNVRGVSIWPQEGKEENILEIDAPWGKRGKIPK